MKKKLKETLTDKAIAKHNTFQIRNSYSTLVAPSLSHSMK